MKSKNGKILDVGCNNTLAISLITAKNSAIARGLRRYECCFSQSLQCHPGFHLHFKPNLKSKLVAGKSA